MRAVLCAGVAASLLLGATSPVQGQNASQPAAHDAAKVVLIRQLLTMTRAADLAMSAIESGIPAQRAANPRIPAVFWDRFLTEAGKRRGDFETMIVTVYERHFSSDEIRQLIAFYQTPIGKKMIAELPAVMQESTEAGRQWGAALGASVASQLESEGVHFTP
jgi:hypothetical protein